jgi:glucose-1-phosphate thymidylyltransferase
VSTEGRVYGIVPAAGRGRRVAGLRWRKDLYPIRPSAFGMVRLEGDRPVELIDKPARTDLRLMWGMAAWGPAVTALQPVLLAGAPAGREAVPGDIFNAAIAAGLRVGAHTFEDGHYLDVGTPAELNRAVRHYGTEVADR